METLTSEHPDAFEQAIVRLSAAATRGVLATGVLTYEPEIDKAIERGSAALAPGAKWAVFDYKMPRNWLRYLAPLFVALGSTFGASKAFMERHIWESVERHLD